MKLEQRIELIHRSSQRMMDALELPRDEKFWWFLRREVWLHLKRSWELWWMLIWKRIRKGLKKE